MATEEDDVKRACPASDPGETKGIQSFSLRIGGYKWTVRVLPKDAMNEFEGVTYPSIFTIHIRDGVPKTSMRLTLIHEMVHALLNTQGRGYQKEFSVEDVCELIAYQFDEISKFVETIDAKLNLKKGNGKC